MFKMWVEICKCRKIWK